MATTEPASAIDPEGAVRRRRPAIVEHPSPVRLSEHLYLIGGEQVSHSYDASAYVVTGPDPVLLDCGSRLGWPAVRANLVALGILPGELRAVLASHCHFDHVTGYAGLSEESAAPLLVHPDDAQAVARGDGERTAAFLYGTDAPPLPVAGALPAAVVSGPVAVEVVHTPGHTPGSCCFVVRDGPVSTLVAADTLFGGYHPRIGSDIDAWSESLARLAELDYEYLSVGHRHRPLLGDARRIVAEARLQLGVYFHPWFRPFHLDFSY